jgi:alkylation response protein AidB-like acyl-CoA dehydrogenase
VDKGLDKRFSQKLGWRGWLALTWPARYGGLDRTGYELLTLIQETSRVSAPTLSHLAAAYLVAPALMAFGSESQKEEFLPRIARGELCISLGYSEPEAGSDLASLRTSAVRDGDEFVITGQKMWGSTTDKADYVWLAARTDTQARKHAGISIFLIPLNTPGITIHPHLGLHGKTFSTQIFDNVRVPHHALVGSLNQGWKILTGALADERILLASGVGEVSAAFTNLVKWLRLRAPLDRLQQSRIGSLAADICVANALLLRTVSQDQPGTAAHVAAAIAKTYAAELMERFAELSVELAGPCALLSDGEPGAILNGELDRLLRLGPMHVIGGGTNEIQRSLIAIRGLDLPR